MGTNYIAPTWRMPENTNKDKLSNYSIDTAITNGINCGSMADLFGTASVTYNTSYSIWVKPEFDYNTGTYQTFFGNIAPGDNAVLLYYQVVGDKWRFLVGDGVGFQFVESNAITSNVELGKGEWQHHCVVFDTVNNNAYYYINKIQINSSTSITKKIATTGNFYIGKKWDLTTGTFAGQVSQGCIFDYALSTEQITYLYNLNNPMAISGAEPIAYWPLGDNSNPTAFAGYPNISVGADSVFDFDGTNDYINIQQPSDFALGTIDFTISAWVFATGVPDNIGWIYSQGINLAFGFNSSGTLRIWVAGVGGFLESTSNFSFNTWQNVVVVRSSGIVTFYINTSSSGSGNRNGSISAGSYSIIGMFNSPNQNPFQGELSNFQLWETALTTAEISTLYNNGQPLMAGAQPQAANLKHWYKLNQHDSYWDLGGNGKWTFNNAAIN